MAEVLRTTFQLRRANEAAWKRNNPILAQGEPGFVIDKNALKIGDGATAWNDLEYIGGKEGGNGGVFNADTHYDFPSIGSVDMIYKAENEKKIYQWNPDLLKYEVLSEIEITIQDLEIIHGGNANGTT
jgi:hypothetical protein